MLINTRTGGKSLSRHAYPPRLSEQKTTSTPVDNEAVKAGEMGLEIFDFLQNLQRFSECLPKALEHTTPQPKHIKLWREKSKGKKLRASYT